MIPAPFHDSSPLTIRLRGATPAVNINDFSFGYENIATTLNQMKKSLIQPRMSTQTVMISRGQTHTITIVSFQEATSSQHFSNAWKFASIIHSPIFSSVFPNFTYRRMQTV